MATETDSERQTWNLLVRNINRLPPNFGVKVKGRENALDESTRLQIFEVAVAAIFARLRPDYEWFVTPNLAGDSGLDFIGKNQFLTNEALGIAAAITVGGQCKKRTSVNNVVDEIAGSLTSMAYTYSPTFFVVALSAHLGEERVEDARDKIERIHNRHCHILDRGQLEGLFQEHLPVLDEILRPALSDQEAEGVLEYFGALGQKRLADAVTVTVRDRVLAGEPFSVSVGIRSPMASLPTLRLSWRPRKSPDPGDRVVTLIGPAGADQEAGVTLGSLDDPIRAQAKLELVTHSVGTVDLGEILIGVEDEEPDRFELGSVEVVENMRPRFFARPFASGLAQLRQEYDRALAKGVGAIGVVGAGGSGKSRLCEEFALDRRRRGCAVVSARQSKVVSDPHRILADLFAGLVEEGSPLERPADRVIQAISRYEPRLSVEAEPAIRAIFGTSDQRSGTVDEQSVLSALLLLIVARGIRAPLIVHLQDLHWCGADVLLLLEKLVWQLNQSVDGLARDDESGVLLVFEGRIRERQGAGAAAWTSEPFEAFLKKLDCPTVSCVPFEPEDGLEFVRLLFEDRHHAQRLVSDDLLELQRQLAERIFRTAGGNPFHSLEQVQILKSSGVLGQNPGTGLLYLIQPELGRSPLPDSIFKSIEVRWRYLKDRTPELALLVWAAALLEDRVPASLFRRLWEEIAPEASLREIEATEMLWMGESMVRDVTFRHEHYFRSIRTFDVPATDRTRVVTIYAAWLAKRRNPGDQFRHARVLLSLPDADEAQAQRLMKSALRGARARGDVKLARRIATTSLDQTWSAEVDSPTRTATFLRNCDRDLDLIRELLGSDRLQAKRRLERLSARIEERIARASSRVPKAVAELQLRQLTVQVLESQILFNDRKPARASEVASHTVRRLRELQILREGSSDDDRWQELEVEALHSQAAALALSGEIDLAIETSRGAVDLVGDSRTALAHRVTSTYANILLARDPETAESLLRQCLVDFDAALDGRDATEINLGMALVLRAHSPELDQADRARLLAEASALLDAVFGRCFQLGNYPTAGAAALMRGIVSVLADEGSEVSWFAQAVAAAARGQQMETLWRAHINLASAMHRRGENSGAGVRDHALAAVRILEDTLSPYARPDESARFALIRIPLAQAVRFLILADDDAGVAALERYPALRSCFADPAAGILREDRGGYESHEWLRIDGEDYVIY